MADVFGVNAPNGVDEAKLKDGSYTVEVWTKRGGTQLYAGAVYGVWARLGDSGDTALIGARTVSDGGSFDFVLDDTEFTVAPDASGIAITARDGSTELVSESRIALYDPVQPADKEKVVTKTKTRPGGNPLTGDTFPVWAVPTLAALAALALLLALWAKRRCDPAVRGAHARR